MESDDGLTNPSRYRAWFDRHVAPRYEIRGQRSFEGATAYQFRCSMLHQGRAEHPKGLYSRILFFEPGAGLGGRDNLIGEALNLDVSRFCGDVVAAAREWIVEAEKLPAYQANFPRFLQRRSNGFASYIRRSNKASV